MLFLELLLLGECILLRVQKLVQGAKELVERLTYNLIYDVDIVNFSNLVLGLFQPKPQSSGHTLLTFNVLNSERIHQILNELINVKEN